MAWAPPAEIKANPPAACTSTPVPPVTWIAWLEAVLLVIEANPPLAPTFTPAGPETVIDWLPGPKLVICALLLPAPDGVPPDVRTSMPPPDTVMVWPPAIWLLSVATAPSCAETSTDLAVMSCPPEEFSDANCGIGGMGGMGGRPGGGGGMTCMPLAATVSAPSTLIVIAPWDVSVLLTVRSDPAPVVVMAVVPIELQDPLTVIAPALVTATLRPLSEVTLSAPAFTRLRSPEKAALPKLRSPALFRLKSPCMLWPNKFPERRFGPFRFTEPSALSPLKPAAWMNPPALSDSVALGPPTAVIFVCPVVIHGPEIVTAPLLLKLAMLAFRPLTFRSPRLKNKRSPPLVPL